MNPQRLQSDRPPALRNSGSRIDTQIRRRKEVPPGTPLTSEWDVRHPGPPVNLRQPVSRLRTTP